MLAAGGWGLVRQMASPGEGSAEAAAEAAHVAHGWLSGWIAVSRAMSLQDQDQKNPWPATRRQNGLLVPCPPGTTLEEKDGVAGCMYNGVLFTPESPPGSLANSTLQQLKPPGAPAGLPVPVNGTGLNGTHCETACGTCIELDGKSRTGPSLCFQDHYITPIFVVCAAILLARRFKALNAMRDAEHPRKFIQRADFVLVLLGAISSLYGALMIAGGDSSEDNTVACSSARAAHATHGPDASRSCAMCHVPAVVDCVLRRSTQVLIACARSTNL